MKRSKNFQIDVGDLMRVVTWNVNGIRAAIRKGMDDWMAKIDADVWLLQEVRALPEQLPKDWELPSGHEVVWHPAEKRVTREWPPFRVWG